MSEFLKESRERILKGYEEIKVQFPGIFEETDKKIKEQEPETALALKYLYMTMPCSDMGNYSFEIFLDYAKNSVRIWHESEGVKLLPEDIYLNYVLYHRVNEEEIAPCRTLFAEEISKFMEENGNETLLSGFNRKKTAIEVNYWCAQEATYHCTDDRTLSALTVYRRGNGRCGEESVFTVNAMRSIGIPSRQVYAPKWSHCDDNHAWVEIWNDGEWYFLGACEPLPILNKGWFTNASSRAMMVHSRWFDQAESGEEKIGTDGMVTMLNELSRYAAVTEFSVKVEDEEGRPVSGAEVSFQVLNYAEFSPVAEGVTGEDGTCSFTTGLGSLAVQISRDGQCECVFADTREQKQIRVIFGKNAGQKDVWEAVDMIAPVDTPVNTDMPTAEQTAEGNIRLEKAAARRTAKTEAWVNPECEKFLQGCFTEENTEDEEEGLLREELLNVLTEKDRTDCRAEVLEEHLRFAMPYEEELEHSVFVNYVLNPRIDDEVLMKYREVIENTFSEEEKLCFRENPASIWTEVDKRINSIPERERASVITTPAGCLKTKVGSILSKKILFVAIARTLGIPARLNPEDRSMEYRKDGRFIPVLPEAEKNCHIVLKAGDGTQWKYFQNWSMAKLENGTYTSLRLGGLLWKDDLLEADLEAGTYRITTSNRLPNGNMFAYVYYFSVDAGDKKEISMILRQADLEDMLENIELPEFQLRKDEDGNEVVQASELTAEGKHILMFLEESREPTEHILNEMMEQPEEFRKICSRILFVVQSQTALKDPTISKALSMFPEIQVYYDYFADHIELLGRRLYVDHEKLPLIIVTSEKLNGIYATSGYNVGTGDMLLRLM
ncbi:transglutaminase domain-containing protein [uncultured Blautia sp.]|uniref:transglutaminase domain-containing protein n=1 Tax=uncultured Blautia sp. TaxID=765821 RepID=UPI00280B5670|nr:transglutaminase domain-containing protein [uncultured Blautia sp.]